MTTPFVRQGNVYLVPVLRHHLDFAELVRRAMQELALGGRDVVAVGLPESVREKTLEAVGRLPRVHLIVSLGSGDAQREVFPVTPADGIVEAVRTASEQGIPLRFVDQEIAPGHLIDRFCMADADWPDDALALHKGADSYLDLIEGRLTHPPTRFEPVDTWREAYMAACLQRLLPRHRRVLFVCNAPHVRTVQRLLREPALLTDDDRSATPLPGYEIRRPSLAVLLRYLDYIPRLVQRYEEHRSTDSPEPFDKHQVLLELIYELRQESPDLKLSIRHFQVFTQVLTKLLEQDQRISPTFEAVLTACGGCFNEPFKERVFRHLLGYFDHVRVERIGRIRANREPLFQMSMMSPPSHSGPPYVARNCTQFEYMYEVVRASGEPRTGEIEAAPDLAPPPPTGDIVDLDPVKPRNRRFLPRSWTDGREASIWVPVFRFSDAMRLKALALAQVRTHEEARSVEFQGALHNGLDFRRTMRSHYRGQPKLYVRKSHTVEKQLIDRDEPVVWLSEAYQSGRLDENGCILDCWLNGTVEETRVCEWFVAKTGAAQSLRNRHGEAVEVSSYEYYGRVSFTEAELTLDELYKRLGSEISARVPRPEALDEEELFRLSDRYGLALDWSRWWDILLAMALEYARETVVLVAPPQFVVPARINKTAKASGKRIARIPTTRFTREELRKLGFQYHLEHQYPKKRHDANDPEYNEWLISQFSDVMKRFWE
ncbi:hypothetical protein [Streptomyces coerulescens]|uniref:Uncharacterized protein n=1 Tax=Streptomyces coerulescens TaxID=29304 RepID=A0ABW0CVE1_STRCD